MTTVEILLLILVLEGIAGILVKLYQLVALPAK